MKCNVTKKIINTHVLSKLEGRNYDEEDFESLKNDLSDKFFEDIKNEIFELEKTKIIEDAQVEIEKEKQMMKTKQLKTLMYEGFLVAFVVGLIVNQSTEIINLTKGVSTKIDLTIGWIILNAIFAFLLYKFKVVEHLIKITESESSSK